MYLPRRNTLGGRYFFIISLLFIALLLLDYVVSSRFYYNSELDKLHTQAEVITEQFIAVRSYIASQQDWINYNSEGNFEFKHLNPARVGKGVGDILAERTDYSIKQTRLQVRNPENAPDGFERDALLQFADDPTLVHVYSTAELNGEPVYRHIVPLFAEENCLDCHGMPAGDSDVAGFPKEGFQVGDLAGAISVTIPMADSLAAVRQNRFSLLLFSSLLGLAILTAVLLITGRLVVRPLQELKDRAVQAGSGNLDVSFADVPAYGEVATLAQEFSAMLAKFKDLYQNMERKVRTRTRELEVANLRLKEGQKILSQLNQKLSENNRLKSEFMATITHELKTPLTSIVAFSELLLDEIPGPLNEEQRENLMDIKTSSQQLMMLISDILDMAKYDAGHLRLEREQVDLNDIFRVVRRTMSAIAYQNNVTLHVHPVNLPLVYGDPERIRQMIFNLISNAIKFSKDGGEIHVSAAAEDDFAVITVKDNGEGIAPEFLPHIFERFRQGDSSTRRRRSGTGLGLALVKTLAELQGGRVGVSSEVDGGTEFYIYLPFAGKGGQEHEQ
ncbi:MAG TPA: DUF3365 domain-containing protein [Firmicutes bacterium]|nr:DUF3365 domain-containing protein [Bacillota bacterium]